MEIKLSSSSKMPCPSWSLPAQQCITGSKLAKISGSTCHDCYALKGTYRFKNVKVVRMQNFLTIPIVNWEDWVNSMIKAIKTKATTHFRWFDSGDLQSIMHLEAIVKVAEELPAIDFWLPTHEKGMVLKYLASHPPFPKNLIVRISAAMINGKPTKGYPLTSTVHEHGDPIGKECIAYSQGGKCLECRACWDPTIPNISYPKH